MKKFNVALKFRTENVSPADLARITGLSFSDSSRDKGELLGDGRRHTNSRVGVIECKSECTDLRTLLGRMIAEVGSIPFEQIQTDPSGVKVVMDICAFFEVSAPPQGQRRRSGRVGMGW
jgi:hypothetical protein